MSTIKTNIENSIGVSANEDEKLFDYITKKEIPNKPENREAKVVIEERLHKEYGYSLDEMQPEYAVRKGSVLIGNADVVIFHNSNDYSQENVKIIVECKRKNRKDGVEQLKTYLAGCQSAEYGIWFNGNEIIYIKRLKKSPHWKVVYNVPRKGEDLGLPEKSSLIAASELVKVFETCHNHIYANDGHLKDKVFNEMLKVLFIKMMDERDYTSKTAKFGITEKEYDELLDNKVNDFENRIVDLFDKAKDNYKDIFGKEEKINLKLSTLAFVVGQLQYYDLSHSSRDVKGLAFQKFVYAHQRGDRGEFFTPDPIISLAVTMINPQMNEIVLDPACGTGGFLVAALKHVEDELKSSGISPVDFEKAKTNFALNKLRGIDFNPDLVKVSKMRMMLEDDGHTGIFHANSLELMEKININALLAGAKDIGEKAAEIILTNPPFGKKGTITDKEILNQFTLAKLNKNEKEASTKVNNTLDEQVPDVLFIERCYHFLRDFGRIAIVLPDGLLSGPKMQYVRDFIFLHFKVIAIISLPYETFIPHGANVKASLLIMQKLSDMNIKKITKKGYNTFLADIEKIGYQGNKNGTLIYKTDEKGAFIYDENNKKILDEDISEVVEKWNQYLTENVGVWEK